MFTTADTTSYDFFSGMVLIERGEVCRVYASKKEIILGNSYECTSCASMERNVPNLRTTEDKILNSSGGKL